MIIIFLLLLGIGLSIFFSKQYLEEIGIWIMVIVSVLNIGSILLASNLVQYEDYTESYPLQQSVLYIATAREIPV